MNPYVILALIGFLALSNGFSFFYGKHIEAVEQEAQVANKLKVSIFEHNQDALQDMQAVSEWAESNGRAQARADANAGRLALDIRAHPLADSCGLGDSGLELLRQSARDANSLESTSASLPLPMSGNSGTGERGGKLSTDLGKRGADTFRGLQAPAR